MGCSKLLNLLDCTFATVPRNTGRHAGVTEQQIKFRFWSHVSEGVYGTRCCSFNAVQDKVQQPNRLVIHSGFHHLPKNQRSPPAPWTVALS